MVAIGTKYRNTQAYARVHEELVTAARHCRTLTYTDVGHAMGLTNPVGYHLARETGQILGEISEDEVHEGRPMLSALAVGKESGIPGNGFFILARQLGKLGSEDWAAEIAFWEAEVGAVYGTWAERQ